MITLFMRFVQDPANAFSWVVPFIFPHFQQLKGTSLSTGVCDHQLLNFKHRYSLHVWGWTRQASLLEVFFSWGIFFLESGLFQLRSKLCLVFFQQANPNLFLLPLFLQNWAFHVLYHFLICSLSPQPPSLLSAELCRVAAGYAFHVS